MKKTKSPSNKKEKKKTKKSEEKRETQLEEEIERAEKAITHSKVQETQHSKVQEMWHQLRETLKDEKEIEQESENQEQEFFEEPIRTIPIQTETSAPVLERIIQNQQQIIPVPDFTNQGEEREEREQRRIDYSARNQPNYSSETNRNRDEEEKNYESVFVPPVLSRREIQTEGMRQEFLRPQEETWNRGTGEQQLDDINAIENEARLPFEEQKKYKRFKLR